jgi:hypothetical protein
MELMLLACSTYVKKIKLRGKHSCAVYAENTADGEYKVFKVETDVSGVMVNSTNMNYVSVIGRKLVIEN